MSSAGPTVERPGRSHHGRGSGHRRRGATRSEGRLAFWLIIPTIIALAVIVGYPIIQAIYRSFFDDPIVGHPEFVWVENYTTALTGYDRAKFWSAFWTTGFYTVSSVFLEVIIGFAMALIMNRAFRGRGLVRTSVLVPWAIPTAVTAVLWGWMLQPDGIINTVTGVDIVWKGSEWPAK